MPALVLGYQGGSPKALRPLRARCALVAGIHVVGAGRTQAALLGTGVELAFGTGENLHNNGQWSCLHVTKLMILWPLEQGYCMAFQAISSRNEASKASYQA